jgi:predicted dehydrogenase
MNPVRFGVIGLNFGRQHVRTLANMEETRLVAIADHVGDLPGGLEGYAEKYGASAYRDGLEMLEKEDLDAVCICTDPRSRAALIECAGRRGVAMFIEKPWATNMDHALQLIRQCQETNLLVMPAFSFRFHPAIVKLRELMSGELGTGLMLNGEYVFNWTPAQGSWLWDPQNGNGFFNENSCHLFDSVYSLLGDPVSVMAEAINPFGAPSEHAAAITLRFAGGAIASLTVGGIGAGAYHDSPRIDVVTTNGQARLYGRDHIWERLSWATRAGQELHELTLPPEALGNTRYTYALRHFIECLRTCQQPSVTIEDGAKMVALAMAVYESARMGKRVVFSEKETGS